MELNECEKQTEETHICVLFFPRHSLSLSPSRPRLHEGRFPLLAFANNPRLRRVDCLSVRRRVSVTGDQFLADSCIIAWGGWPAAPVSSELVHVFASAGKGKDIKEDKKKKLCRSVPLYSRAALKGISLPNQTRNTEPPNFHFSPQRRVSLSFSEVTSSTSTPTPQHLFRKLIYLQPAAASRAVVAPFSSHPTNRSHVERDSKHETKKRKNEKTINART